MDIILGRTPALGGLVRPASLPDGDTRTDTGRKTNGDRQRRRDKVHAECVFDFAEMF
jgi:hypothetical protein